jgi:uncharacterized protein
MAPRVDPEIHVYCCFTDFVLPAGLAPVGLFREAEGLTAIVPRRQARQLGLACEFESALITLGVQSDLTAVGFLAAVTSALRAVGVPCNVVSAFHHDHLLVPAQRARRALRALRAMRRHARRQAGRRGPVQKN